MQAALAEILIPLFQGERIKEIYTKIQNAIYSEDEVEFVAPEG